MCANMSKFGLLVFGPVVYMQDWHKHIYIYSWHRGKVCTRPAAGWQAATAVAQTCMFKALSREGSMWIWEGSLEGLPREVMMRGRCARRAFSRAASSMSMLWWCVYLSARGAPDAASTDCTSSATMVLRHVSVTAIVAAYMHHPDAKLCKHGVGSSQHYCYRRSVHALRNAKLCKHVHPG